MAFDTVVFLESTLIIFFGATVQAATGLGGGLVIVPFLAILYMGFVPGPVIFASLILSGLMAFNGRSSISTTQLKEVFSGLMPGMAAGAALLSNLPVARLGVLFGFSILTAVIISAFVKNYQFNRTQKIAAGVLSGFMGTTAAVGAPVLALLYQFEDGKVIRATLGLIYFISSVIMLIFLHFAGQFSFADMALGVYLMPGFVLGYLFAGRLSPWVDRGFARPMVLAVSAASAVFLIAKSW
jgi:uncharacterized membrane protein YfcA